MSYKQYKRKINRIFRNIQVGGHQIHPVNIPKRDEYAYETLVLTGVIKEYIQLYGPPVSITPPLGRQLNHGGTTFHQKNAFKVEFLGGKSFFFAQNIYVYGLASSPGANDHFEVDVVVIKAERLQQIIDNNGYPKPKDIHCIFECKHGAHKKSHLRELIGTKRHVCLRKKTTNPNAPYPFRIVLNNSHPDIPVVLVRRWSLPVNKWFSTTYADYFEVYHIGYT